MTYLDHPDREMSMAFCIQKMARYEFGYHKRTQSIIWASKDHDCPTCKAEAFSACINLTDVKRLVDPPRQNKQPHDARVDWVKLATALKERGYK